MGKLCDPSSHEVSSIKANGGSFAQVANSRKPGQFVVYDGQSIREFSVQVTALLYVLTLYVVQAYDIKLIMNKGVFDIIRPQWIKDCVTKGELLPLKKKCVFFRGCCSSVVASVDVTMIDTSSMLRLRARLTMNTRWKTVMRK